MKIDLEFCRKRIQEQHHYINTLLWNQENYDAERLYLLASSANNILRYFEDKQSELLNMSDMIDVNDYLPDYSKKTIAGNKISDNVLICDKDGDFYIGYLEVVRPDFISKYWSSSETDEIIKDITHWKYLPNMNKKNTHI